MTTRQIRRWVIGALLASAAVVGMGCTGEGEEGDVADHIVFLSARDLGDLGEDETYRIDLTDPGLQVIFDRSFGRLDWPRVSVTCPNGANMPMAVWLADEAVRRGDTSAIVGDRLAILGARISEAAQEAAVDDRSCLQCEWCPDGAYVCHDYCGSDQRHEEVWAQGDAWRWLCPPGADCAEHQTPGDYWGAPDPSPWGSGSSGGGDDGQDGENGHDDFDGFGYGGYGNGGYSGGSDDGSDGGGGREGDGGGGADDGGGYGGGGYGGGGGDDGGGDDGEDDGTDGYASGGSDGGGGGGGDSGSGGSGGGGYASGGGSPW